MSSSTSHHIENRHKDSLRSFYTEDIALVGYMIKLLNVGHGDRCLEPCAGSGCFIDGLLRTEKNIHTVALDVDADAISVAKNKFSQYNNIEILQYDFLDFVLNPLQLQHQRFSKIIANPPYGGWQSPERRAQLKKIFPDIYVKETYSLFLAASLRLLEDNGRAVFIIPDTFLYLHMHKGLRKNLLTNYSIVSIDIFPSNIFPNVNFGYAKMCIICIDNTSPLSNHTFNIRHSSSSSELYEHNNYGSVVEQVALLEQPEYSFGSSIKPHNTVSDKTLEDYAKCVTGIYTGDDAKFIRRTANNPKGKRYEVISTNQIAGDYIPSLSGISTNSSFIPLLKGGGFKYFKPIQWYINWNIEAVDYYKLNKKARFQNKEYYFKKGIGFPMVSSNNATASILKPQWMFDQSIVGIFPFNEEHFGFIFALMNSAVVSRLLLSINPSANNSAKYIRRIPIIMPDSKTLAWFNSITEDYLNSIQMFGPNKSIEEKIDCAISEIYDLKSDSSLNGADTPKMKKQPF